MRAQLILFLIWFAPVQLTAAQRPTAGELLDKYQENMSKSKSFIDKAIDIYTYEESGVGETCIPKHSSATFTEFRYDGNLSSCRQLQWGNIDPDEPRLNEEAAEYVHFLWDGKDWLSYARSKEGADRDVVIINRGGIGYKDAIKTAYPGSALQGFASDNIRIDSVLQQANTISVRDRPDLVGGSECFVIDASSPRGEYTIWVDPDHGYNIAKSVVRKGENHLSSQGEPMAKDLEIITIMKNVRFEKIDDVWIPMEADMEAYRHYPPKSYTSSSKHHHTRTEVHLNPDHDAPGSFLPDDIRNGAKVYIRGIKGVTYTWQDGKVVDRQGQVVLKVGAEADDSLDKLKEWFSKLLHFLSGLYCFSRNWTFPEI
jgi:hypothetical protein